MRSIRGGKGLGDAMYVQAVARYFVKKGESLEVCTNWGDVFLPLMPNVKITSFRRDRVDILAHYSRRKALTGTDQFQDCCIEAKIKEPIDFKLDWSITDPDFVADIKAKAGGRKIVLVQYPRPPMDRSDGFGAEVAPDWRVMQRMVDSIKERYFTIQIGAGKSLYKLDNIHLDLANKTTIKQLIDLGYIADGNLGYCSFMVPLAEQFDKPAIFLWSRRGVLSKTPFIRQITPTKILHEKTSLSVMDDDAEPLKIMEPFCNLVDRGG